MKPSILGFGSKAYPEGRIDYFKINEKEGHWESIVECLVEFGFKDDSIRGDIDFALEDRDYLFLYLSPKLKVHLSAEGSENFFMIRFDTSIPRKEVLEIIGRHFQFSESN